MLSIALGKVKEGSVGSHQANMLFKRNATFLTPLSDRNTNLKLGQLMIKARNMRDKERHREKLHKVLMLILV